MNLARIILIVAALSIAVGTAFLVKNYLQSREAAFAADGGKTVVETASTVKVLVAESDLAAGTIVNEDLFRWQNWPDDNLSSEYVVKGDDGTSDGPASFTGWAVRRGIAAGEPITKHRLVEPGSAGFLAGVLRPGMRAAAIEVSPDTSASGFIMPGDSVDVMLTQQIESNNPELGGQTKVIGATIISNVRVVAVDQELNDIEEKAQLAQTVTVELTPSQSENLAVAKEMGKISLSLRSLSRNDNIERNAGVAYDEHVSQFLGRRDNALTTVLAAKHSLKSGTLLNDTNFTWKLLDAGERLDAGKFSRALTSMGDLRGSYLKVDLEANSAILRDDIILPGEPGYIVAALQPGMRAVSMSVNPETSVSGWIAPGDRVDLVLTHSIADASDDPVLATRWYSETILQDLRLLAIGQEPDLSSSGAPTTGDGPSAGDAGGTVTLEVTPNQAEAVNVASRMGGETGLSLVLRSDPPGNTSVANNSQKGSLTSDVSISPAIANWVVLGGTSTTAEAAEKPKNLVVIYRAGTPTTVVVKR